MGSWAGTMLRQPNDDQAGSVSTGARTRLRVSHQQLGRPLALSGGAGPAASLAIVGAPEVQRAARSLPMTGSATSAASRSHRTGSGFAPDLRSVASSARAA